MFLQEQVGKTIHAMSQIKDDIASLKRACRFFFDVETCCPELFCLSFYPPVLLENRVL